MKEQGILRGVWRLIYPVLLYELLSLLAVDLVCRVPGITEGTASLTSIVLTAVIAVPVFKWMCRQDEAKFPYVQEYLPMHPYYLIWGISSCAALALLGNVIISLTPLMEWSERFWETQEILTSGSMPMQILATVLAAPILEEMLIRGVLYPRMRGVMGVKAAVVFSSALFALLHGNLVQGVYAFVMGAYFAWLMERFGNIWVPILGHMSANLFVTLMGYGDFAERFFGNGTNFILELIICAACVGRTVQILGEER